MGFFRLCKKCGAENLAGYSFCKNCGEVLPHKPPLFGSLRQIFPGEDLERKRIVNPWGDTVKDSERDKLFYNSGNKTGSAKLPVPWMMLGFYFVVVGILITMFASAWSPGVTVTEEWSDGSTNTYWEESENYDAEMQERACYIWEGIIFVIVGFLIFVILGLERYVGEQKGETKRQEIIGKEYAPVSPKPPTGSKSGLYVLIFFVLSLVVIFGLLFSFNNQSGQNSQDGGGYDDGGGYVDCVGVTVHNEHNGQYVDIWVDGEWSKTVWIGSYSSVIDSVYVGSGSGTHYIMAKGEYYEGYDGANAQAGDFIVLYV